MHDSEHPQTTHFGYETVPWEQKQQKVGEVFESVAPRYDLMNDAMSLGIHRLWKRFTINQAAVRHGHYVLDIAGGTGDLAGRFCNQVGSSGMVVLSDINHAMLKTGKDKLINQGCVGNMRYVQANAEYLPFPPDTFDRITMAFGLRNVTDKQAALTALYRVLKPGGKLLVLEFSRPVIPGLGRIYDYYSFTALPLMGRVIANDARSYRYLAESIRKHPDQDRLTEMFAEAGFEDVTYYNLSGGIVALHCGYKY